MKTKTLIEITNPHEVARLLNLIRDGRRILEKQDRTQRGIDGYTKSDLEAWEGELSKHTNVKCEYADSKI